MRKRVSSLLVVALTASLFSAALVTPAQALNRVDSSIVKFRYAKGAFRGTASAGFGMCLEGRKVVIFKKRANRAPLKVGATRVKPSAGGEMTLMKFKLRKTKRPGRYFAKLKRSQVLTYGQAYVCKADRSAAIKVKR